LDTPQRADFRHARGHRAARGEGFQTSRRSAGLIGQGRPASSGREPPEQAAYDSHDRRQN
jgi:hypothetical protein